MPENPIAPKVKVSGRPRDPDLANKVYSASMQVYAGGGWQAFTFDAVSKAAGVGKAAMYRRWTDREDLLTKTLQDKWLHIPTIDTGDLKRDLTAYCEHVFDALEGHYGRISIYLRADMQVFEPVRRAFADEDRRLLQQALAIVHRGVKRGELPLYINPDLVKEVIVGAISNHVTSHPREGEAELPDARETYIDLLVAMIMAGQART